MSDSTVSHLEVLLQRSDWARALARRLVDDGSEADDLVQESYAVALERAPARGVPVLSWFACVMRNLARQRRRASARRELRERASAREERIGSEEVLLERFEQQRVLAEELARLAEPYRSALLMRYFGGLSPEEIARRAREPVRTIHSRLHRGLAQLRERLQRRSGGDGREWLLALFPLALERGGVPGSLLGGVLVNVQVKTAIAVAAVGALAATAAFLSRSRPLAPEVVAPRASPAVALVEPAPIASATSVQTERVELDRSSSGESSAPLPAATVALQTISGRVVDVDARPLAGLEVGLRSELGAEPLAHGPRATTGSDGSFALSGESLAGRVTVESREWVALFEPSFVGGADSVLLVAARAIDLAGQVVDPSHAPIEGAELSYLVADGLRARFPVVLDGSAALERSSASDAHGRFELARIPNAPGGRLRVRRHGFETALVSVPEAASDELVVVLQPAAGAALLAGRVEDARGEPVADALVALGGTSAHTDARGGFTLRLELAGEGRTLQAVKQGHLPARLECGSSAPTDAGAWPAPLVLRLGGPPLSIEGVVRDARGEPVPRAQVSIVDRTYLGPVEVSFGVELVTIPHWIEPLLAGTFFSASAAAGEDGRFRLEGLLPRSYTVQALDPRSLAYGRVAIEAGSSAAEVRVACEGERAPIRGRIVDRSGAPVAGALVLPQRAVFSLGDGPDAELEESDASGEGPYTDEQGRFELAGLCRDAHALYVTHPSGLTATHVRLAEVRSLDDVEVVLSMQCHVQVDLEGSHVEADNLRLLDAQGGELTLVAYHGNISYASNGMGFTPPRSEAFVAPENAATLVLRLGEREVQRIPLFLKPGQLNVIRP